MCVVRKSNRKRYLVPKRIWCRFFIFENVWKIIITESSLSLIESMEKTSRMYVLDLVEAITNQIQFASHCQELLHFYYTEYNKNEDKLFIWLMEIQQDLLDNSIIIRRRMMERLKTETTDEKMRCSLKHAISAYWFALETHYANPDDFEYKYLAQLTYEQMMKCLSIFMWLPEIVTCWRCLCDQILEKNGG